MEPPKATYVRTHALVDFYGRHTQAEITFFGLRMGSAYPTDETSGKVVFTCEDETTEGGSTVGGIARSILAVNSGLDGMDRFFPTR